MDTETNSVLRSRKDLSFYSGMRVRLSGRVKEIRKHPKRRDLNSVCLVNVFITPEEVGESLYLDHLWVLVKQLKAAGLSYVQGKRISFPGEVYPYQRLGGKSIDRGLYGTTDYGVLPVPLNKK